MRLNIEQRAVSLVDNENEPTIDLSGEFVLGSPTRGECTTPVEEHSAAAVPECCNFNSLTKSKLKEFNFEAMLGYMYGVAATTSPPPTQPREPKVQLDAQRALLSPIPAAVPAVPAVPEVCRFESLNKSKLKEFDFIAMVGDMYGIPVPAAAVPAVLAVPEVCRFESLNKSKLKEFDFKAMVGDMYGIPVPAAVPAPAFECCRFETLSKSKLKDFNPHAMLGVSPSSASCADFMG
jgi:hypothetical protein